MAKTWFEDIAKGADDVVKGTAKKAPKKPIGHTTPTDADRLKAKEWLDKGNPENTGVLSRVNQSLGFGLGNYQQAAIAEGRTALGMAGRHAIQGGAWGAVLGGSIEAAQGGSFWDGAKQGAFNGAVGVTAIRGAKRAVGGREGLGGYFKGEDSMAGAAANMWRATSGDAEISGQARAILKQRSMDGVARSVMNSRKSQG